MAVWSLGLVDRPRVTAECAALVTCGNAYPLRSAICNQAERDSSSPAHVVAQGRALLKAPVMIPGR